MLRLTPFDKIHFQSILTIAMRTYDFIMFAPAGVNIPKLHGLQSSSLSTTAQHSRAQHLDCVFAVFIQGIVCA